VVQLQRREVLASTVRETSVFGTVKLGQIHLEQTRMCRMGFLNQAGGKMNQQ
jgi:hypothetical protein